MDSTPYGQPGDLPQPRVLSERAFDERRKTADESRGSISTGRWMWEWFKAISTAVLLFLTIRTFVVEAFKIPTGSMERTLLVGDFLLVNKAVYGAEVPGTHTRFPAFAEPNRGDVIVFLPPHDPAKNYVKRLVGLPGDTLEMHDKVLYRNGEPLPEPYVRHID
ncbi:MAG TPA: signal peptidase I, partial [Longimicrobiaceae bacterium]|nr:signal peptidase I [Longimicrobiaceae bacterium]